MKSLTLRPFLAVQVAHSCTKSGETVHKLRPTSVHISSPAASSDAVRLKIAMRYRSWRAFVNYWYIVEWVSQLIFHSYE